MELDAAFITVVVDNETDTLSSPDPGTPRLPEIAGLLGREDIAHHRAGRDGIEAFGHLCVACHGFSALVPPEPAIRPAPCSSTSGPTATCGWPTPSGCPSTCGAIARQTDYETGLPGHLSFTGDEAVEDPLIMDERCLSFRVRGRGTTVLSACSHAGVVNASLEADRFAGGRYAPSAVGARYVLA
jgi:hypothetical protein